MPRFILIDNGSGYIWGDSADLNGAIWRPTMDGIDAQAVEFATALDASNGEPGRAYEVFQHPRAIASNQTGYHVYRSDVRGSDQIGHITDGQDQEMIDAVVHDCEYVCTIATSDGEG